MRLDLCDRSGAGQDDGEDVLLSYAAGDELCVLAAEVQDDDRGSIHVLVFQDLVRGARRENEVCCFPFSSWLIETGWLRVVVSHISRKTSEMWGTRRLLGVG